jgi:hypothetical protein
VSVVIKPDRTVGILLKLDPRLFTQPVKHEMDRQNDLTIGYCQENKLSSRGPMTLGVVTGKLRQSMKRIPARVLGPAIISGIGSNLAYAAPHEFGFKGTVRVPAHWRKPPVTNKGKKLRARRAGAHSARVREHDMRLNIRERAYTRRSISERIPQYLTGLREACIRALRGDNG